MMDSHSVVSSSPRWWTDTRWAGGTECLTDARRRGDAYLMITDRL